MSKLNFKGTYTVNCYDIDHNLLWTDESDNIIPDDGLQYVLDTSILSGTQLTSWYVGLISSNCTTSSSDTLISHSGWSEINDYTEGNRQVYTGIRTSNTVDNTASVATFTINADVTIGGSFICSVMTGDVGTLLSCSEFKNGDKDVLTGQTLEVTYNFISYSS